MDTNATTTESGQQNCSPVSSPDQSALSTSPLQCKSPLETTATATSSSSSIPLVDAPAGCGGQQKPLRSSSPFQPNTLIPIHKRPDHPLSAMSSSPPIAATADGDDSSSSLLSPRNLVVDTSVAATTRLSPTATLEKESVNETDDKQRISPSKVSSMITNDGTESVHSSTSASLSDVETFNGKIVYNPDGSAYIIEGPDSDGSDVEAEISQEGSIIDARGHSPRCGSISFPQIVSAFHISRSTAAELYSSLYPNVQQQIQQTNLANESSKAISNEAPIMHSYRVFTLRNNNESKEKPIDNNDQSTNSFDLEDQTSEEDDESSKLRANQTNCPTTVPVKPILMCFICKLSFGFTKSFVAHAIGEHRLVLNDDEKRALSSKNASAIIQGVGKDKDPLLSFLQPKSSPEPFRPSNTSSNMASNSNDILNSQQRINDAQRLLAAQMAAVASALRSTNQQSSSDLISASLSSPNVTNENDEHSNQPNATATSIINDENNQSHPIKDEEMSDCSNNNNDIATINPASNKSITPSDAASQFASELADLANLEKFAQAAAAAAAQQQQMDLHSIAAVMAAAVAASNQQQNKSNHNANRTPSPGSTGGKVSSPKNSQMISQMPNAFNQPNNAAALLTGPGADAKSISSLFQHSPSSDGSDTSSLLATVANHVTRPTLTSNSHPPLLMQHSRNSCKTLKCPKCNWHYKYQETLEIHMKEKHPENEMNCIYCLTNQPHPRLARGETYTCGYKPYRCDVCNYSTTTKGNLSIHMQSDKHINNVQELQNGNIPATAEHLLQSQALAAAVAQASAAAVAANGNGTSPTNNSNTNNGSTSGSPGPSAQQQDLNKNQTTKSNLNSTTLTPPSTPNNSHSGNSKQKATWRCDVCNYETNVARNLRIHMTSEKHTHNMMVLKQNVTQMQQINALQQGILNPEQLLQLNPGFLAAAAAAAAAGINNSGPNTNSTNDVNSNNNNSNAAAAAMQPEVALADMAYNHALLMMASQQRTMAALMQQQQQQQQQQNNEPKLINGSQATFDMEHADPCLSTIANSVPLDDCCHVYHCCVCGTFTTDSIEALNQHIQCDRTRTREDEVLMSVGGSYICKLCSYKTNLKANFQLHCKTDKHLQRLQHVNHIKEGGVQSEWKLKLVNMSNQNNGSSSNNNNNVQVIRCNLCNYYTNSIHKLQLHSANPRHDVYTRIFQHLLVSEFSVPGNKYYHCSLCSSSTSTKIHLIQHLNSFKHARNESIRQLKLQHQPTNKDSEEDIRDMFLVKELRPTDKIQFETPNDDELNSNNMAAGLSSPPNFNDSTSATAITATTTNDPLMLKNALMEQAVKLGLQSSQQNEAFTSQQQQQQQQSSVSNLLHLNTTDHHHQQQQLLDSNRNSTNSVQPSILCPLCQDQFHEKLILENHLVETHNVNKEGVQRLMLLVDTSELDKFNLNNNNNMLSNNKNSAKGDTSVEEDENRNQSNELEMNESSKLMMANNDEEMIDTTHLNSMLHPNQAILEHLMCPICQRMFLNLDELFNHMTIESHVKITTNGQFQCWRNGCIMIFKTISATQQHFKDQHFSKCVKMTVNSGVNLASSAPVSDRHVYKYRCSQCSLAFKTFEKLQIHSQYHLIRAATQCVICSRSFRTVESLQKHVETSHSNMSDEELEQYKANIVNNQLLFALGRNGGILDPATTELLKKESCRVDNDENDSMMDIDNNPSTTTGAIDLANNKDSSGADENSQMDSLDNSTNTDNNSNPLFPNGNMSSDNSSLEDYLNSQPVAEDNYNDPNRKFKCHRCKVAFTRQSYLTSHNKTLLHRKGEKMSYPMEKYLDPNRPFKCEICKESFTQKNILLVHYNSVSHLHKLKQSMKESSAAVAASVAASSTTNNEQSGTGANDPFGEDGSNENKPFKCNLCKVSYSNAPSLHDHLRSSLHQTRTSKLHELAQSGQLDLSLPLIEPLSYDDNNVNSSKVHCVTSGGETKIANSIQPCPSPSNVAKFPVEMLANLSEQQQQALALQQAALNLALATGPSQSQSPAPNQLMPMNGQSPFTCIKCGAAFISQEAQFQHQQLCGLFGNITNVNMALAAQAKQQLSKLSNNLQGPLQNYKNKPQLYKHLLETWGFEIVMQFNESNQKKKKQEDDNEQDNDQKSEDEATINDSNSQEETADKPVTSNESTNEAENENIPPEINKCQCDICFKEFSSIWVLKAHREEIHKDVVPLDVVESFADEYRNEYDKKFSNDEEGTNDSTSNEVTPNAPSDPISNNQNNKPSSPNTSTVNNESNTEQMSINLNPCLSPVGQANNLAQLIPNLSQNASQTEIAVANQMAAHIQFSQLLMQMGLAGMAAGMPMPAGMNVPFAAAAMGIPPQLIPVMMADPMMAAAAAFNNPALAAAAAAAQLNQNQVPPNNNPGTPSPVAPTPPIIPVQPVPATALNPQTAAVAAAAAATAASQQKRARTRISDEQLKVLRQYFDINNSPTEEQLIEMSQKSGLPMKVIKHWFRNTLFKERQRNKDSPYNFNNPPSTFLNLDEYEKTGEAKVFTLDDLKKTGESNSNSAGNDDAPTTPHVSITKDTANKTSNSSTKECKPHDSESEYDGKNSSDLKSSSSNKDTDYATSDDEEVKRNQTKENDSTDISKHQFSVLQQQQAQDFDQLSKTFSISSPQPSESSMSSMCDSSNNQTGVNSTLFAGLANFNPTGLQTVHPNLTTGSPIQLALDAAQRSQLAVAAATVAANAPNMIPTATSNVGSTHSTSGKRANRTRFTDYQIKVLQEFFESNAYPKDDDLEYLSKLLNLSPRVIVVWFQNARQKARKVYENQPPTTPVGEDDGSGRFQRTPGLNYQCKKCLQVFQRYYELIKHQKSSCFKDENPLAAQIRMAAEARAQATSPSVSATRDSSTPIDCTRSATATPEKVAINLMASPNSVASPSSMSSNNNKTSPNTQSTPETQTTFRCDKCPMVFNRLDLWRDHQIVHIVNSNLFNTSPNPFGSLIQMDGTVAPNQPQLSSSPQPSPNTLLPQPLSGNKRKAPPVVTTNTTTDEDDDDDTRDFDSMSGNGNSNSSDQTPRDKRLRTTILPEQLDYLYQKYQVDSNPSRKMLESIAKEVGLKKRVVQVWFQNTRARERKGQYRAHQQVIHKRCPFCRALFKARSALESHLATRHADQYTKGDINIDNLPDGDPSEDGDLVLNDGPNQSPSGADQSNPGQMADVMKRYEDSFKKYLDELNIQDIANIFVHLQEKMTVSSGATSATSPATPTAAAAVNGPPQSSP